MRQRTCINITGFSCQILKIILIGGLLQCLLKSEIGLARNATSHKNEVFNYRRLTIRKLCSKRRSEGWGEGVYCCHV